MSKSEQKGNLLVNNQRGMQGLYQFTSLYLITGVPNTSLDNLSQKGRQISPSSLSLTSEGKSG